MPSSGSYDFSLTRDNIIDLAHQHIGAVGEGESASSNQVTEAGRLLNMIVKLRHTDGMPAWALKRGYVLPVTGVSSIATNSHIVDAYDTTLISSTAASGATTLDVSTITGFSASDQIGVEQSGGTMQWTTISGAPSGSTITLASALTGVASTGGRVYSYTASTDRVEKPIRIIESNRLNVGDDSNSEVRILTRNEYYSLGDRTTTGTPNSMYYTILPTTDTAIETNGQVFFYPRFNNGDYILEFTYQRPLADFDAAGDTLDFPQAFYLPIMMELAALLGPKFGVPIEERRALFNEAKMYREEALASVYEEGSFYMQPEHR